MTLAPRADVFIELACEKLWISRHHHSRHQHTHAYLRTDLSSSPAPTYSKVDSLIPFIPNNQWLVPISLVELPTPSGDIPTDDNTTINCLAEPSVQAGAAKLQTSA